MIGKLLAQIVIGVGVSMVEKNVLPKVAEKARKKLDELKAKRDAEKQKEEAEEQQEKKEKTKVYAAEWH
jgi:hypothetical protein